MLMVARTCKFAVKWCERHQARAGPPVRTAAWSWQSVFAWRETKVPPVPITDYYSENFTTKTYLQPLGHSSSKLISGTPAIHLVWWRSRSDQRSDGKSSQWKGMEDQCQLMITNQLTIPTVSPTSSDYIKNSFLSNIVFYLNREQKIPPFKLNLTFFLQIRTTILLQLNNVWQVLMSFGSEKSS